MSSIAAGTTTGSALVSTGDTTGELVLKTNGTTTAVTIDTSQNVTVVGNLSFNSGYGSSAVAYGCRAWVNFQGTGTVAIREDGNVSSITDNGTGDYTVNFTNAMPDANYAVNVSNGQGVAGTSIGSSRVPQLDDPTTSAVRIATVNTANATQDREFVYVAVFR